MKLIRLTTDDDTATFDCSFNDGIIIKPDSKIAVQSASASLGGGSLTLSANNNDIFYQITDTITEALGGGIRVVHLNPASYVSSNAEVLLRDIENTLNNDAKWISPGVNQTSFKKILGLEWNISIPQGRMLLQYQIGSPTDSDGLDRFNVNDVTRTGGGNEVKWGRTEGIPASFNLTSTMISKKYLSRGNSYYRCKIGRCNAEAGGDGFIIGVTTNPVAPKNWTANYMTYAIKVGYTDGVLEYSIIKTDAGGHVIGPTPVPLATATPTADADQGTNDTMEVAINGNRVELNIWKNGALAPIKLIAENIGGFLYNQQKLYPFATFYGSRTNANIGASKSSLRLTPSPFDSGDGLEAPPRGRGGADKSKNFLQFQSSSLASYLGYDRQRIPEFGEYNIEEAQYLADNVYTTGLGVNGFIIQLLNLTVDSYDSFREQRENILAVIPSTDSSGELVYMPPFPIFIDMMNKNELSVRNIRLRIVNTDYTPLPMEGIGLVTLLID